MKKRNEKLAARLGDAIAGRVKPQAIASWHVVLLGRLKRLLDMEVR